MSAWDGLDEFVAVAGRGSFTAAARSMGVSTTHMSRSIARLEARLQAQLLHRTTRSVALTDTGRIFLEHCARLIRDRDEAIALVNRHGEPEGDFRITCSTAMGERFVAPIARRFVQAYPNVSLTIDLTNRVVDIVAEGYDLAIRTGQLADSRLIGTRIASRKLLTCASLVYLERRGMPGSVDDLAAHDCILGSSVTWHFVDAQGEQTIRPKSRWRCNSGIAVSDAAIEGMGICQLPDFYVIDAVSTGRLVTILDDIRPLDEPIWALYPQRRHLSPKINRFLEMMRDQLPAALNVGKMPPFESVAVGAQTDLRDGANSKLTLNKE